MDKKMLWRTLAFVVLSMALGMFWHFVAFHDLYRELGIYNRAEPVIPLGLLSMLTQGAVMACLFPYYRPADAPLRRGLQFAGLMGLFLFSVSTLANAAKIEVSSITAWLAVQSAFHVLQFGAVGVVYGLIDRKTAAAA